MFSMTTEYALRAAVYLCECSGSVQTSQRVAEATQTPVRYASRVLQLLVEGGVANSQRGPSGGFTLARPSDEITLLDVVQAVEPIQHICECPLKLTEHCERLCPLHTVMEDIATDAEDTLRGKTLADVMSQSLIPLGIQRRGKSNRSA